MVTTALWTGYACGDLVCPNEMFMAGMRIGLNEDCGGGGDFDFSSYSIYCCEL